MSLQVWLPLVRDLNNQGLSSASPAFNANNSSIVANGKLGNCLKTTAVGEIDTNCNVDINTSSLSFGGWYKFNKAEIQAVIDTKTYTSTSKTSTGNLIGNTSYGGIGLIFTTNDLYANNKVLTNLYAFSTLRTATVNQSTTGKTLDFDVWTHLFTVWNRDTLTLSFYVNGELFNSKTFSTFSDATNRNLFINYMHVYGGNAVVISPPSYVNDMRIYDHALSQKEVKLLSQGLVCHYTLGDRSIQQMNNCYSYPTFNTSSASGGWSHWGGSGHIGTYGQNTNTNYIFREGQPYSHWVANGSGATYNYLVYQSPAFEGGTRSLCCIIKHENGLPITDSICYPTWNARSGGTPINAWTSIISLSNGFYLCKCENIQQDGSNDLVGVYVTAGNKIYISEGYLENDRVCCSDIFYNDTTVYDSSGLNNHMTAYGDPTISANTIRNSVSTHFINGQYALAQANANTYLPKDAITVNIWMNCSTWGNPISCTEGGGWNFESASAGIQFPCYISGVGYKTANSGVTASTLLNAWHMLTGVFDGTSVKIYIDAELKTTTATGSTNGIGYASNRLVISGEAGGATPASSTFVGEISDVRIYATPLSAEDIKALYNTPVSISNTGAVFTQGEFVEV